MPTNRVAGDIAPRNACTSAPPWMPGITISVKTKSGRGTGGQSLQGLVAGVDNMDLMALHVQQREQNLAHDRVVIYH